MLEELNKIFLFLDEVQQIEGWERYVRSIYDEYKGRIKIFAAGSCSDLVPILVSYFEMMKEAFLFFDATVFPYNVRDQKQYPRKNTVSITHSSPDQVWEPAYYRRTPW